MPNVVQFGANYKVHLSGFNIDKPITRSAIEDQLAALSTQFNVNIRAQYEAAKTDRVDFSPSGSREAQDVFSREHVQVQIPDPPRPATPQKLEPLPLEEFDIYDTKPPKDADEAFVRFLKSIGATFQKH